MLFNGYLVSYCMGMLLFPLPTRNPFCGSVYIIHGEREGSDQEPQGRKPVSHTSALFLWPCCVIEVPHDLQEQCCPGTFKGLNFAQDVDIEKVGREIHVCRLKSLRKQSIEEMGSHFTTVKNKEKNRGERGRKGRRGGWRERGKD